MDGQAVMEFHVETYGPVIANLLVEPRLPELGPGVPVAEFYDSLRSLDAGQLFAGRPVADPDMAACCRAALWLWFDFLNESHEISQRVNTPTGNYWHGIMHRREPDYSNAKYWFRRVALHPIYPRLTEAAASHPGWTDVAPVSDWDSHLFVDLCQRASGGAEPELERECREIARLEWRMLFDHCYRAALG